MSITLQRDGKHRLELGCGRRKFAPDFVGVDRLALTNADGAQVPDIVADLDSNETVWDHEVGWYVTGRWPWAQDNSCSFIIAHQTLEHIHNLIPFMNEVWRIADEDCWVEVIVPYYRSPAAFQDPTHVRFFTEMTLRYWEPGMVEDFSDYGITGYFGLAAQRWREDGNLWALLRPLKTKHALTYFTNWQSLSENVRPEYPMRGICPAEILARCDEHHFLGGPE